LDWWDETNLGKLKIAFTPSRHSSGRGISDQSATLWGAWCLIGTNQKIFFSGDSVDMGNILKKLAINMVLLISE